MNDKYILGGPDGHTPILCEDLLEWGRWMEKGDRRVKQEEIGHYRISTVFLGLDHNMHALLTGQPGPPILFETMVFHVLGHLNSFEIQERCATWDEAVEQHDRIASEIRKSVTN